ncbi:MAG: DUF1778 domain-containing protein [Rhodomicrobium sp.]
MKNADTAADVTIHLRATAADRDFIDRVAEMTGTNRSQFMLSSALKEARNLLLDRTTIYLDNARFHEVLAWMDAAPAEDETAGMQRLMSSKPVWQDDTKTG